jgi:hypothetical protein
VPRWPAARRASSKTFYNLLVSHDDRSRVIAVDYTAQGFGYEEVEAESAALLAFLAPGRAHDLVIDKPSA